MALELAIRDVEAGYGAVRALHGVSLSVGTGATVALLGTNGNGKSTLMKCVMGMVRPTRGSVSLTIDGTTHDLTRLSTEEIVNLGVAMVPEGRRLFPRLTVEENLLVPSAYVRHLKDSEGEEQGMEILRGMGLAEKAGVNASQLSQVELRKLELARAMAAKPRLLISDEAMAGLAGTEVDEVLKILFDL
ncbi:MAG: ATP-binding cassette domain-containing protein, partial [Betaproteobacteria bacterium]|nr:ATP-binding cassette domain-containing protein [Betaproteobacteria bacterium]